MHDWTMLHLRRGMAGGRGGALGVVLLGFAMIAAAQPGPELTSADQPVVVTNLPNNPADASKSSASQGRVAVNRHGPGGANRWGEDPYELVAIGLDGDALTATVSYGGGCRDHEFTLVLADAFMMTDPVRLRATLAHEANDDPCEAWLTEDIAFDLTPVRKLHGDGGHQGGTVVLMLSLADGTDRELAYVF